jgi:Na+-transporting NADH:ubiquinone oxidoreductase subunit NqrC
MSATVLIVLAVAAVAVLVLLVVGVYALQASQSERHDLDRGDDVFGPGTPEHPTGAGGVSRA